MSQAREVAVAFGAIGFYEFQPSGDHEISKAFRELGCC